jgi:UDP-N-acetylglucosamine acyltransferase
LISKTAIIDSNVKIGKNTKIAHGVILRGNVVIGDNCDIKEYTVIEGNTTIGDNNQIFHHCVIGVDAQALNFDPSTAKLVIGNNNTIRELSVIHTGGIDKDHKATIIGDNNLIMSQTHIGHDCVVKNNVIISSGTAFAGHVVVEDGAILSGQCGVHQFVHIGAYSMSGGGAMIDRDIAPFSICAGNRAKMRGLNLIGLRRGKFKSDIKILKQAYQLILNDNINIKKKAQVFLDENPKNKAIAIFCNFIINSSRGLPLPK